MFRQNRSYSPLFYVIEASEKGERCPPFHWITTQLELPSVARRRRDVRWSRLGREIHARQTSLGRPERLCHDAIAERQRRMPALALRDRETAQRLACDE